jgi:prepilin-type N-terminal cleavage/methylation domain-containing protein
MRRHRCARRWGFSLLEVVIVVAIIAILAAIGIPRMSRGAKGANDSALASSLQGLRTAIDMFGAEHAGSFPDGTNINGQLTQYSDASGNVAVAKDTGHIYGPYIRVVPPLPVGARKGGTTIATADAAGVGWIYDPVAGKITANTTTEADDAGKLYNKY